jgi:hypothetical protein
MPAPPLTINRYQRLLIIVAIVDVLVILLFPPFNDVPLARGSLPNFSGFHPLISLWGVKPVATDLLSIQLFFVLANTLAAFLFLQGEAGRNFGYATGIAWFTVVNGAIILLFPPFEPYPGMFRSAGSSFDSFNFILGNRVSRPIFVPLLYLECVFIAVNALTLWLLFNTVRRGNDAQRARREKLLELAEGLDDEELDHLTADMERKGRAAGSEEAHEAGRKGERRRGNDPGYRGPERRRGRDRRHR